MKKNNMLKVSFILILTLVFMFSSYSLNFFVEANEIPSIKENKMVIITEDEVSTKNTVDKIAEKKIEEPYEKMQDKISNNDINIDITTSKNSEKVDNSTSIVADVSEIKGNESYKDVLKKELKKGKRVFLYGDVQAEEYKEILDLDKLSVDAKDGGEFLFGLSSEELNKKAIENGKSGTIKDKDFVEDTDSEFTSHVIGYTLNDSKELQYVDISIHNFDEKGNPIPNTEEALLKSVMNIQSEIIDSEQKKYEEVEAKEKVAFLPFIRDNKVKADNLRVLNKYGVKDYVERLGVLVAKINTDYHLYKQTDEKDNNYDFFTLEPVTQINSYKGFVARSLLVDIDIPYDTDELDSWSPMGDVGGSSISVGLSYPFSISFNMDFGESLQIDDRSSTEYDFARWFLEDNPLELYRNISGNTFTPVAGWASTGTFVTVGLTVTGEFDNYITLKTENTITYNY